jgi:hypothetical protein
LSLVAAGCNGGQPGELSAAAEKLLVPKVQEVRDTAATGTYAELQQVVKELKRLVDRERADGQLSDSRANAIDDAADQLLLDARPTATPTPTQSSEKPTPTPTQSSTPTPTPSSTPTPTPTSSGSPSPGTTVSIGGLGPH